MILPEVLNTVAASSGFVPYTLYTTPWTVTSCPLTPPPVSKRRKTQDTGKKESRSVFPVFRVFRESQFDIIIKVVVRGLFTKGVGGPVSHHKTIQLVTLEMRYF